MHEPGSEQRDDRLERELLIICTEGLGAGPYNIKRIAGMGKAYQAQDAASFELAFTGLVPEGIAYQPSTDRLVFGGFGIDGQNYFSSSIPGAGVSYSPSIERGDIVVEVGSSSSTGTGWPRLMGTKVDPEMNNVAWAVWFNNFNSSNT